MGTIYDYMKSQSRISFLIFSRNLRDEGKLPEDSLALALVKFGDLPGITREHMIAEISTFFVAGCRSLEVTYFS